MKKNILPISLFCGLALLAVSCKKTYECHCEKKSGGETHVEVKAKKSDAEHECHELAEDNSEYSDCHLE